MKTQWRNLRPWRRVLCLLMAALFCLSAAGMAGTLAYSGGKNTPPNEFTSSSGGGGGEETTSMTVNKVWSGGSSRPSIQVQLYRDGTAQGAAVTLSGDNDWRYTWKGLSMGHTYSVDEVSVPSGYAKSVVRNSSTSYTITNTYNGGGGGGGSDYTSVNVTKVWAGDKNDAQPASVQVQLYRNGKAYGNPVTLSADNGWKHTWTRLSDSYTYTVDEPTVPEDYTKEVTHQGSSWTITNTYKAGGTPVEPPPTPTPTPDPSPAPTPTPKPEPGEQLITVTKTWRHGSNPVDAQPGKITVYIMNGAAVVKEVPITAADGWTYSVSLPRYDESGKEIKYTVTEAPVAGYRAVINGTGITNIHESAGDGGPKTGDDNAILLWFALMMVSAMSIKLLLGNVTLRKKDS